MSLASANRMSELHDMDLRFRRYTINGVVFKLASLIKKRQTGAPLKEISFASCKWQTIVWFNVWSYDQPVTPQRAAPLFLSYVKPHKPVTTQRLAHWIKDLLKEAGANTEVFKAHSVRGATTSAALDKGVYVSDILSTADWSRDSTFWSFYYCPSMDESTFAQRVWSDWLLYNSNNHVLIHWLYNYHLFRQQKNNHSHCSTLW